MYAIIVHYEHQSGKNQKHHSTPLPFKKIMLHCPQPPLAEPLPAAAVTPTVMVIKLCPLPPL
jgi:hypothetical protein